jgi:hypothetical protein
VNDIEDLREAWNTLDTCFDRPEKYIAEALEPIVKFRSYKMFDNGFMDQKWRDALNVPAAEPVGWGAGSGRAVTHESDKRGPAEAPKTGASRDTCGRR